MTNQRFQQIDELKKQFESLQPLSPENQHNLERKLRLEWNYNSNHLEGNTLTPNETALLLFFDRTSGDKTLRENEEMKAHDIAIKLVEAEVAEKDAELTERFIRELNKVILVRPFWKNAETPDGKVTQREIIPGEYKKLPNSVRLQNGEMFYYASPEATPSEMHDLVGWYRKEVQSKERHPAELAALLHYRFVRIHPFDDGNGRVARLLMNYHLLRCGFQAAIIKSAKKGQYLTALNKADTGNLEAFVEYVAGEVEWSLNLAIKAANGEDVSERGDWKKQLAILDQKFAQVDRSKEILWELNKDVFIKMFDAWIGNFIDSLLGTAVHFNKYYTKPAHYVGIVCNNNSVAHAQSDGSPVSSELRELLLSNTANSSIHEIKISIRLFFGTFRLSGLNPFGCSYYSEIHIEFTKYMVLMDTFRLEHDGRREPEELFSHLLHEPLTTEEISTATEKLGQLLTNHLEHHAIRNP